MKKYFLLILFLLFFSFCKNSNEISGNENNNENQNIKTYYVSPSGDDSNSGDENSPWRTISHAINLISAGERIFVKNGTYEEHLYINIKGTSEKYIIIEGEDSKNTILNGAGAGRDTVFFENAEYVKFFNFKIINSQRAGIRLSYSNHIELSNLRIKDPGKWGIFTDFSDYTTIKECEISGAKLEHGIYISNSSDNALIKNNRVYDNYACGIQINADPSMGGDGISSECTIENNIIYRNGRGGGAAINLASVRDSRIQNNLIHDNYAGGIAMWDDGQGYEWGCKNNKILHNTIYFNNYDGRWAVSIKNGSSENQLLNNIICGGGSGGLEYDNSSENSLISDYNIFYRKSSKLCISNDDTGKEMTLAEWQSRGYDIHSYFKSPEELFKSILSCDFHLKTGAFAIDRGKNAGLSYDFENDRRPQGAGYDIGCDEAK